MYSTVRCKGDWLSANFSEEWERNERTFPHYNRLCHCYTEGLSWDNRGVLLTGWIIDAVDVKNHCSSTRGEKNSLIRLAYRAWRAAVVGIAYCELLGILVSQKLRKKDVNRTKSYLSRLRKDTLPLDGEEQLEPVDP
jgi:hypothetical protein